MTLETMEESLRERFLRCETIDEILALAKRHGLELTDDDVARIALARR